MRERFEMHIVKCEMQSFVVIIHNILLDLLCMFVRSRIFEMRLIEKTQFYDLTGPSSRVHRKDLKID